MGGVWGPGVRLRWPRTSLWSYLLLGIASPTHEPYTFLDANTALLNSVLTDSSLFTPPH